MRLHVVSLEFPSRMSVIYFPDDSRPSHWRQPVLALGNFDGFHRGHMKIIDRVCSRASDTGSTPVAMIFDPHPPRVVRPDRAPALLMTKEQKIRTLMSAGVQGVVVVRFTEKISRWKPEVFVRSVLVNWLGVTEVWVGTNFLFGCDRSGNFTVLRTLGKQFEFRAEKINAVRYKEFVISSTRIRRLIREGRVDEVGALLGHHYTIDGAVIRGDGRGGKIGFPTANVSTENELIPPYGVYATMASIDGIINRSITNIGVRPSVSEDNEASIETYLFDVDRDLYGLNMKLGFIQRLRDEKKFENVDLLREQIEVDCLCALKLFDRMSL